MKRIATREPKTECFAYHKETNECKSLTDLMCTYKNCPFFRHKSEINFAQIESAVKHYSGPSNQVVVK